MLAFVLEFATDTVKLGIDAAFGIHDHLVVNRMNIYDAVNISTVGYTAECLFCVAVMYVQTMQ